MTLTLQIFLNNRNRAHSTVNIGLVSGQLVRATNSIYWKSRRQFRTEYHVNIYRVNSGVIFCIYHANINFNNKLSIPSGICGCLILCCFFFLNFKLIIVFFFLQGPKRWRVVAFRSEKSVEKYGGYPHTTLLGHVRHDQPALLGTGWAGSHKHTRTHFPSM